MTESADASADLPEPQDPSGTERLAVIAQMLRAGEPALPATVRELLNWFQAHRRGYKVVQKIREAMWSEGLVTTPAFESAYIDSQVSFVLAEVAQADQEGTTACLDGMVDPATNGSVAADIPDPTFRVRSLPAANRKPLSVKPDEPLSAAVTLRGRFTTGVAA